MPDGFFPRRLAIDIFERQRNLDKFLFVGHGLTANERE